MDGRLGGTEEERQQRACRHAAKPAWAAAPRRCTFEICVQASGGTGHAARISRINGNPSQTGTMAAANDVACCLCQLKPHCRGDVLAATRRVWCAGAAAARRPWMSKRSLPGGRAFSLRCCRSLQLQRAVCKEWRTCAAPCWTFRATRTALVAATTSMPTMTTLITWRVAACKGPPACSEPSSAAAAAAVFDGDALLCRTHPANLILFH